MAVNLPSVGVRFEAQGDQGVLASLRRVESAAAQSGRVVGSIGLSADAARTKSVAAAQGIANALEGVARTGETGGAAIRQMVTQVGHLAFAFGIGGPLTAAVGVAGLAIVQMLTSARDRARDLIAEIQRANLAVGQAAEEEARGRLQSVTGMLSTARGELSALEASAKRAQANLAGPEGQRRPSLAATGVGVAAQEQRATALRAEIAQLESDESSALQQAERANRSSAMALMQLLRQLKDAGRATAKQLGELSAIESRMANDVRMGNLNLDEQVALLPRAQKATKSATVATEDASKAFDAQFTALLSLAEQGRLTTATYAQLRGAAMGLALVVAQGTGATQEQVKAWEQLKRAMEAVGIGETSRVGKGTGKPIPDGTGGAATSLPIPNIGRAIDGALSEIAQREANVADAISTMLAAGITDGFAAAVASGSIGEGFAAMTKSFLRSLGQMVASIGQKALQALVLESTVVKALAAMNPAIGIPAALGLIALGGALAGAGSGGGGGGGAGLSGGTSAADRGATRLFVSGGVSRSVNPLASSVVNLHTVNPADPATQRLLASAVGNFQRRSG